MTAKRSNNATQLVILAEDDVGEAIATWTCEEKQWVSVTGIRPFPTEIFELCNLTTLILSGCGLVSVPRRIATFAPKLRSLSLANNPLLAELPDLSPLLCLESLGVNGTRLPVRVSAEAVCTRNVPVFC